LGLRHPVDAAMGWVLPGSDRAANAAGRFAVNSALRDRLGAFRENPEPWGGEPLNRWGICAGGVSHAVRHAFPLESEQMALPDGERLALSGP